MSKILLFLIITIIIFKSTHSRKEIMLLEGDTFEETLKNSIESKSKLFLIFHVKKCPFCDHVIRILKERIINNYEDEDEINFGVVNLDRQSNIWLGIRFNITRIPFIILIENKKMYQFQNQFEESTVLKFIDEEKTVEDSMDIPENLGMMGKVNAIMRDLKERIKESMQIIFDKYGIKLRWNNTMTYILLTILLISIIYIENKLIDGIRKIFKFNRFVKNEDKDKKTNEKEKEKEKIDGKENANTKENTKEDKKEKIE